jgi:adenosylcobinamide-GDP ribazoletransferase
MKSLLLAFQFLTRLPIRINEIKPDDLARSMAWFPLVGLFIGLMLVLILFISSLFNLTPEITAGLLILVLIIFTGGLHLDGLSDTADGFYAGKNREEILRIMNDSHTGAIGVIAIVIVLLLKYAILVSLLRSVTLSEAKGLATNVTEILRCAQNDKCIVLLVVPAVSRWGMVVAAALLPPAKSEGLGKSFLFYLKPVQWIIATFITSAVAIGFMHLCGFIICLVCLALVIISVLYIKQRIGGLTGDTLGAINEVLEVGGFFTAYIIYRL